jgi:hypothetical protein
MIGLGNNALASNRAHVQIREKKTEELPGFKQSFFNMFGLN